MKKAIALSLLAGASIATAAGQIVKLTGASEFVVSPGQYGKQIKSIETRFFEQGFDDKARVFKVVTRTVRQTGLDGINQESVIEAHGSTKSLYDTKLWTAKFKGGAFEIFNDRLIQLSEDADEITFDRLINAQTGKLVVETLNESAVELEVPNSKLPSRYLAQVADPKAPDTHGTLRYIGSIGYFDETHMKNVARIYAALPNGWGTDLYDIKPILRTKDAFDRHKVTLWSADGATDPNVAFNDVGLSAKFSFDQSHLEVSVVIDQDRLSLAKSKASPNVQIDIVDL